MSPIVHNAKFKSGKLHLCSRILSVIFVSYALLGYSADTIAWGRLGHSTVGVMALSQLQPEVYVELKAVLNPLDEHSMDEACNWPDEYRETEEGAWSSPLHYINIPRGDHLYLESRDCPDQLCATEAIKHYAVELANPQASQQKRRQAFKWLCHLVGDLHQPLHAGFADDRGGNDVYVTFNDEPLNLHSFWDSRLISQYAEKWQGLVRILGPLPPVKPGMNWSEKRVNDWTNESHALAMTPGRVYPAIQNIDDVFQQQSWELIQQQLKLAATRLAFIINFEFKDRE